jgi:hypothetical protein
MDEPFFRLYPDVERMPWSVVAKSYAEANRLVISWIVNARPPRYGYNDLKTGEPVLFAWPVGVSNYRALYRHMLAYVAEKRQ